MNLQISILILFLLFFASPIFCLPHFFPNISSIPPSLIPNETAGAWQSFQNLVGGHTGDKIAGISKLKQYFRYFGYINNSSSNFTDEFDDDLESAIKIYQLNFNLNSTGKLDAPTIKQILRPRCGVADIINGSTTMNSGKSSLIHLHAVAHYSFFPGRPRWPASKTELTYAFLRANNLSDSVKTVFSHAFERWSEVTPLTFTETASFFTADIRIGFFSGDHGDGEPFDGVLGTLAHAFSPPSGLLHMDGDENWIINGGILTSPVVSAVDVESVAVHEIGHLLGLGHSSVDEAIMFPSLAPGARKVELTSDDVDGIQALYGSNPNYNSTSPTLTTTQERDTNLACTVGPFWMQSFVLAVGLVLFVL